jgi:hypothetical protein
MQKPGAHIWAERYDRPAGEASNSGDEVVRTIVGTLIGRLGRAKDIAARPAAESPPLYDWVSARRQRSSAAHLAKAYLWDGTGKRSNLCESGLCDSTPVMRGRMLVLWC